MKTQIRTKLWLQITVCTFIGALLMPGFALGQKDDKNKKKQENEVKASQKDENRIDKAISHYTEALAKARERYTNNDDFREEVNFAYRSLLRIHAKDAFNHNTLNPESWVQTTSGEKIPRSDDTLYDSLLAQDYVNRVGQSLVPANSEKRYGFKITLNPMPDARSLSTGTIYISTGMLSLVDNEAQLAYILGHEIAHIEKEHWRDDVLVAKYIESEQRSAEKKGSIIGAAASGVTFGLLGKGATGAIGGALFGGGMGFLGGKYIAKLFEQKSFDWSPAQEDEADKLAINYMLDRNYDVRESQTFYETLKTAAIEDPRIELDHYGDRYRTEQRGKTLTSILLMINDPSRLAKTNIGSTNLHGKSLSINRNLTVTVNRLAKNQEKMSDDMKTKIQNGEIMAGDGEFENLMSTIKRDNGIVAFYYDMYKLSARNLSQALAIRSDDALGYFYYGRVLKLTARKAGEKEEALSMFAKAIELDKRNANPQSRLYLALTKMSGRDTNNIQEIVNDLKQYVALYQQMNGGGLPPNMNMIYDYMQEAGELNYNAFAVTNVRTVSGPMPVVQQQPANQVVTPAKTLPKRKP